MPLVDCKECEAFKVDVSWGTFTDPPLGYCPTKETYIWKLPTPCTKLQPSGDKTT